MPVYMVMTFGTFSASRKNSLIKVSMRSCGTSARIRIDHRSQCASYGYLAAVLITDLTMAGLLSALLYKQRKETPYQRSV